MVARRIFSFYDELTCHARFRVARDRTKDAIFARLVELIDRCIRGTGLCMQMDPVVLAVGSFHDKGMLSLPVVLQFDPRRDSCTHLDRCGLEVEVDGTYEDALSCSGAYQSLRAVVPTNVPFAVTMATLARVTSRGRVSARLEGPCRVLRLEQLEQAI